MNGTVLLLVVVWYGASVCAITTSKMSMQLAPLPFCLCFAQFTVATVASALGIFATTGKPPSSLGPAATTLARLSTSYTFGFMFTNVGFSLSSAPFVETVKSSEPISTVLLAYLLLGEVDSLPTYLCLVPIVAGVAAASMGDMSFSMAALLVVQASNMCFSSRSVFAKRLRRSFPAAAVSQSDVELFFYVSLFGLLLIAPARPWPRGGHSRGPERERQRDRETERGRQSSEKERENQERGRQKERDREQRG